MYTGHIAELAILLVCVVAFFGYHIWLYNFENPFMGLIRVPTTMAKARQVWTRSICADDKDVITGVQTIRNSLMTVTLFTVAAGYIGARAIPEILLTPDMLDQLNLIQVRCSLLLLGLSLQSWLVHFGLTLCYLDRAKIPSRKVAMAPAFCSHQLSLESGLALCSYASCALHSQRGCTHIR